MNSLGPANTAGEPPGGQADGGVVQVRAAGQFPQMQFRRGGAEEQAEHFRLDPRG